MCTGGIIEFLKESVRENEFICLNPNYYNDSLDTLCLPFLMES